MKLRYELDVMLVAGLSEATLRGAVRAAGEQGWEPFLAGDGYLYLRRERSPEGPEPSPSPQESP